jgi:hypothetical protein
VIASGKGIEKLKILAKQPDVRNDDALRRSHLHSVVPTGGLAPDHSRWLTAKSDFFLPIPVPRKVFLGKRALSDPKQFLPSCCDGYISGVRWPGFAVDRILYLGEGLLPTATF